MNINKLFHLIISSIFLLGSIDLIAQQYIPVDVGSHSQMDTSDIYTYGYWFEATSCFRLTGARVPLEVDSVDKVFQIVIFDTVPTTGPVMTDGFEILEYISDISDTNIVPVNLVISTGDYLGVLGGGSSEQMIHSMHIGPHSTLINGVSVDFKRLVYDGDLNTSDANDDLYTESNAFGYSRVELYYDTDIEIIADFTFIVDESEVYFYDESNGGDSYLWNFGDGNYSDEQYPLHEYSAVGTYIVSLSVTDFCGVDFVVDTIEILSLSINDSEKENNEITVMPNPTTGRLLVSSQGEEIGNLLLYDITGKQIDEWEVNTNEQELNLSSLPKGVYFLQKALARKPIVVVIASY
ncbi:MAG: T9SS type A sorting domain-containing protein [Flavobacteriales bacterium]|nr:T9SS type A sorting domain-containing protein [Flavobacteriales bacterium]